MNIGLIAGGGQFPMIFARAARKKGFSVYAVAHHGETDPELKDHVDGIVWLHLGQLKKNLSFFKENGVSRCVMMGSIKKARLFKDFRPDMKALALIAKARHTHDDNILRKLADFFAGEGITVEAATDLMPHILAEKGCWTRKKPSKENQGDIEVGWKIAKEIGKLDVGQCLVIQKGSVLAVEAIDGTDSTIRRGGSLGGGDAVVVKICKPNQDLRFDIPAVGLDTVKNMHESGVTVLAIEAGKAVVFDREEMISFADSHGLVITAL